MRPGRALWTRQYRRCRLHDLMIRTHLSRVFLSLSLVVLALSFISCGGDSAPAGVLARSTYGDLTEADLEEHILGLPPASRRPPEEQEVGAWRRELIETMLVTRRLDEEAKEADLLATDEGRALLDSVWRPVLASRVQERRIIETVEVTEQELREYYDANPKEFGHGPQVRVRHIFKRTTRDASEAERAAARAAIDDLHRQLTEGASFIELARNQSDSETSSLDGLIGRLDPGALGPAVDEIVWALDEGEFSEVVSTPVGFHIFKVENKIAPFQMDFAEAATRLRRRFERLETEATIESFFDELIEASGAFYDPEALERADTTDDTVLFSLGDFELTYGQFMQRLFEISFPEQRAVPLLGHLEKVASQELYLWQAEQLGLESEPNLAAQLEETKRSTRVELAYRARRRAHLENLDDELLRAYYEENAQRFRSPNLLRVRLLVRLFDEEEGQQWFELYEELDRLAKAVRAGEADFAAAAAERSQDPAASRSGDSGWIRPGAIGEWAGPRAGKAVLDLQLNQISDPILIEDYDDNRMVYERRGYMLVRPEEIREPGELDFDDIRDRVAEHYVVNGSEDLQKQIAAEVLAEIDATILEDRL